MTDSDIDQSQQTPTDYTILVKNIPKGLDTDYELELYHLFRYNAVPGQELKISKIVLVYDIDYLLELEDKLE